MKNNSLNLELIIVVTTESDMTKAKTLARALLEQRLAACVSMQPVNSYYWWEGRIEDNDEVQLFIKTTNLCKGKLFEAIKKIHSYETPELISWPVSATNEYTSWLDEMTLSVD